MKYFFLNLNLVFLVLFLPCKSLASGKFEIVTIELSLDQVQDATDYEIEIKGKKSNSILKKQESPEFQLELPVGHYQIRSRAWINENFSDWSEWMELLAPPEAVEFKSNKTSYLVNKKQPLAKIQVDWMSSQGAVSYLIEIQELNTKNVVHRDQATTNSFSYNLPVGQYRIGVKSVSKDGIKSEIKYFAESYSISQQILPKIKWIKKEDNFYSWEKINDSQVKIEIYRKAFFGSQFEKLSTVKTSDLSWSLKTSDFLPGEYRLQFQHVSETFKSGPEETITTIKKPEEIHFKQQL